MADPGKDKKRTKIIIEHGKSIFGLQQKQQQNITSYPFLLLLQTRANTKEMEIKHTHKQKHKLTACAEEWSIPFKTKKEQR